MRAFWFFIGLVVMGMIMVLLPLFIMGCSTPPKEEWECCEDSWGVPFCYRVDEAFANYKNAQTINGVETHDTAPPVGICQRKRKNK